MDVTMIGLQNAGKSSLLRVLAVSKNTLILVEKIQLPPFQKIRQAYFVLKQR